MAFDADAFLAARTPWALTLGGRQYTAAPVSVQIVLDFQREVKAADTLPAVEGVDQEIAKARHIARALGVLFRALFPWRLRYIWQGDPARRLMRQDPAVVNAALADFFGHLAARLSNQPPTQMPPGSS